MHTLCLDEERAIILRDGLMLLRQQTPPDLRQPIQELLDAVDLYIALVESKGVNHVED